MHWITTELDKWFLQTKMHFCGWMKSKIRNIGTRPLTVQVVYPYKEQRIVFRSCGQEDFSITYMAWKNNHKLTLQTS